jgi:hypothetical protein
MTAFAPEWASFAYYNCFQGLPLIIIHGPLAKAAIEEKTQDNEHEGSTCY